MFLASQYLEDSCFGARCQIIAKREKKDTLRILEELDIVLQLS